MGKEARAEGRREVRKRVDGREGIVSQLVFVTEELKLYELCIDYR